MPVREPVLITGASGFIGGHLVRSIISTGKKPILLSRFDAASQKFDDIRDRARIMHADLTDGESIKKIIFETKPATIIHLAGTRGNGDARGAHIACEAINAIATAQILEAAVSASVERIVIVGSAEEYGDQSGPLVESMPVQPRTPYGISKAKATEFALNMHRERGCPVVIVRPFSVYGSDQPRSMFIAEAVESSVRNITFQMSHGEQRRDLIFVNDVVRGLIAAASVERIEGQIINLGTGRAHRLRDVAEMIWKLTETEAPLAVGARYAPQEELHDTWADITLARRLLDWEPQVDLETGLRETIRVMREQLEMNKHLCQTK